MGAITTREISAAPAQAATHAPCDDEPAHGSHPPGSHANADAQAPRSEDHRHPHAPDPSRCRGDSPVRLGPPLLASFPPRSRLRTGSRHHADRLRVTRRGVPHSCPKRLETHPLNHAGRDLRTGREPAWMLALVVDRRQASGPSARLAMQKVEGSSPFIRFGKAPETGPFCCRSRTRRPGLQPGLQPERIRSSEPDVLESVEHAGVRPTLGAVRVTAPVDLDEAFVGRVPERRDRGGRIVRPLGAPGVGIDGVELCAAVPTDDRLASGHDSIVGTGATLCHFHDQFPGDPLAPRSRSPRHSTPCALATRM